MEDPLIKYKRKYPNSKRIPQYIFIQRFELGFCNSPRAWQLMKKEELSNGRSKSR